MEARRYLPEDHSTLARWWEAQKWPVIPASLLPPTGFVVDGVCAGFLYRTDSPFCVLEWVIANPARAHEERSQGLDRLISTLLAEAKNLGCTHVFTSAVNDRLIERYQAHGFQVTERGMTNLIRGL